MANLPFSGVLKGDLSTKGFVGLLKVTSEAFSPSKIKWASTKVEVDALVFLVLFMQSLKSNLLIGFLGERRDGVEGEFTIAECLGEVKPDLVCLLL